MPTFHITDEPSPEQLQALAAILERGGVVLMPTDTIYGLHAVATNDAAVNRIATVKGRAETKPFVVIAASVDQLEGIGVSFSDTARAALGELWPAPLTAILPLREAIAASRGARSLAVRVPQLQWLRALLALSGPLASTSVNRAGEPPLEDPSEVVTEMQTGIDSIVNGGRRSAAPSTIVDFTASEPRMVREGDFFFTQKVWKRLRKLL